MGMQLGALQGQKEAGAVVWSGGWKDFLCFLICFSKRTEVTKLNLTTMPPHRFKK